MNGAVPPLPYMPSWRVEERLHVLCTEGEAVISSYR